MASTAPGRLDQVRAFLNTVDFEEDVDPLAGPDRLAGWLAQAYPGRHIDEEGLAALRAFREALRLGAQAHAGHADAGEASEALQPFLAQARFALRMAESEPPVLCAAGEGVQGIVSELLAIVYDATAAGTWQRLKACRKSSCRWAFYDGSKNGSGTWCDMAVCGNRVKAQRRRAREKTPKNIA